MVLLRIPRIEEGDWSIQKLENEILEEILRHKGDCWKWMEKDWGWRPEVV